MASRCGFCDRAAGEDGREEGFDLIVAAECGGNADPAADDGEDREDDEREEHEPGGFVDARGPCREWLGIVRGVLIEARLAEEGHEPEAEHVEGGHAGGDEADEPEELAEPGLARDEGLVEDLVLGEEAGEGRRCRRWRRRRRTWSRR